MTLRCVVLISGRGSLLPAIAAQQDARTDRGMVITGVVCNRPRAPGVERARTLGLETRLVDHRAHDGRERFEAALQAAIEDLGADLVVCAGFMRILTPAFVAAWNARMINTHPSLLPAYPGLDTHARALANGDAEAGASVHLVTAELDGGPVIARVRVPIRARDDAERLGRRVRAAERSLLPEVIGWVADGRVDLHARPIALDGQPMGGTGIEHRMEGETLRRITPQSTSTPAASPR